MSTDVFVAFAEKFWNMTVREIRLYIQDLAKQTVGSSRFTIVAPGPAFGKSSLVWMLLNRGQSAIDGDILTVYAFAEAHGGLDEVKLTQVSSGDFGFSWDGSWRKAKSVRRIVRKVFATVRFVTGTSVSVDWTPTAWLCIAPMGYASYLDALLERNEQLTKWNEEKNKEPGRTPDSDRGIKVPLSEGEVLSGLRDLIVNPRSLTVFNDFKTELMADQAVILSEVFSRKSSE